MTSPDQPPTTGQERPARLSEERERQIRACFADFPNAIATDLFSEIDALRAERGAWKARAERLISDAADIQRYWQDEGVHGDGFCFSLNWLLRDACQEEPLEALAEPQPPCPGYVPTGHVCERCGQAPSEHSRARGLDGGKGEVQP